MKITGIHQSKHSRPVREAVYSGVYSLREYQAYREDPRQENFLTEERKMVDMKNTRNQYLIDETLKVALIYRRFRRVCNLLLKIANNPDLLKEEYTLSDKLGNLTPNGLFGFYGFSDNIPQKKLMTTLASMKTCFPAGVITDMEDDRRSCDIYQLCPWCRYKATTKIYQQLRPMLSRSRKIIVSGFLNKANEIPMDLEIDNEVRHQLTTGWRKKNKLMGGYTITLPEWHALHDISNPRALPCYSLSFNTFMVAVAENSEEVKAVHHCTDSKSTEIYAIATPMLQWKANAAGLQAALGYVMKYPTQLLATRHACTFASEIETVISARPALGRSSFGEARSRND
jgi:hypothetical protein